MRLQKSVTDYVPLGSFRFACEQEVSTIPEGDTKACGLERQHPRLETFDSVVKIDFLSNFTQESDEDAIFALRRQSST